MNFRFIENDTDDYRILQHHLNNFVYDHLIFGQDHLVADNALILALFIEDMEQTIETLKGAVIVSNYKPNAGTAEITMVETDTGHKLLTRATIVMMYDYLFRGLQLRKCMARVSEHNKPMINGLRKFGWKELINPKQFGPEEDEHIFYYFQYQWEEQRPYYTRSYKDLQERNRQLEHRIKELESAERRSAVPATGTLSSRAG